MAPIQKRKAQPQTRTTSRKNKHVALSAPRERPLFRPAKIAMGTARAHSTAAATTLAASDLQRRRNRLQRRQSAGDAMAREDIALIESILPSIAEPAIQLDAMGCFILGSPVPGRGGNG